MGIAEFEPNTGVEILFHDKFLIATFTLEEFHTRLRNPQILESYKGKSFKANLLDNNDDHISFEFRLGLTRSKITLIESDLTLEYGKKKELSSIGITDYNNVIYVNNFLQNVENNENFKYEYIDKLISSLAELASELNLPIIFEINQEDLYFDLDESLTNLAFYTQLVQIIRKKIINLQDEDESKQKLHKLSFAFIPW